MCQFMPVRETSPHATRLIARGATRVVPETIEASLQLSELILIGAGVPDDAARHLIEVRRQAEQAALNESSGEEERRADGHVMRFFG